MKIPVVILVFSFLYLLIVLFSSSFPMFWDMGYVSRISNLIYENHFSSVIFSNADNGTPPLYSLYLAGVWAVLGTSLMSCHLAILPFVLATVYQFYNFAKRFFSGLTIYFALALLLIEPTMATQTILAGCDIVVCFLFLCALNCIMDNKRLWLAIAMMFLPLLNSRGFSYVVALFLIDIFINRSEYSGIKKIFTGIVPYLPAFFLCLGWLFYHYRVAGWIAVSDGRETFHHVKNLTGILRNFTFILWKIVDFGRISLYLFLVFVFFKFWKVNDRAGRQLFIILLFTILPYIIFFLPLSYPVSHRYFMVTNMIAIVLFAYSIGFIKIRIVRYVISVAIVISLLAGNFIQYPERFGNGWDSSLKVIPFFNLKEQLDQYLTASHIAPADVGAEFPMNFDRHDCNPASDHFKFTDLDTKPFNYFPYIVQSNICNTFTPAEIAALNGRWQLVTELRSWPVYIKLFKNPVKAE